jgi:uncharacterized protein YyaL (SSP411 family)
MHMSLIFALALAAPAAPRASGPSIAWQDWSEAAFARAGRESRLVLLDLGAVWCHWCHVMDETTYRDPEVLRLLERHFVTVRVDQDARPDLANRYEDYGWPATIVFDAAGGELVRFKGYIEPERMRSLLRALALDPTPGPSVTGGAAPSAAAASIDATLRRELEALQVERYDPEHGGWGFVHKYLDADSVEHALLRARQGDADAGRRARETLARSRALLDPVWGGVYQYSDSGVWTNPHFEKIMSFQADALRAYSLAYAQWRDEAHLAAAREVHRYLRGFLRSPEGAFYASQDADVVQGKHSADYFALGDAERRRRGLPRVDTSLYARENGWAVQGLVALYQAGGDRQALEDAVTAARWTLAHRSLPGGGFAHGARDTGGPFLADTLAAGRAFVALHGATGEREWLARAEDAAAFIDRTFRAPGRPGFVTAAQAGVLGDARPQREENVQVGRLAARLQRETGRAAYGDMARHALSYLSIPEVARRFSTAGPLLLLEDLEAPAARITSARPASK